MMVRSKAAWREILVILAVLAVLATVSFPHRTAAVKHGHLTQVELPVAA